MKTTMVRKKNPSVSLRGSDIRRMKKEVTEDAVNRAFVIFFTVMHDKWGFGQKRLGRMLKQIIDLGNMLDETPRCVTIEQLKKTLKEELGIEFK